MKMKLSHTELKKQQVITWINMCRKSTSNVKVCDYSYNCLFSGLPITKTLIVFPDELETKGVITIDKPLIEVEEQDILKLREKLDADFNANL